MTDTIDPPNHSECMDFDAELHADRLREECGVFGILASSIILRTGVQEFESVSRVPAVEKGIRPVLDPEV